ncbi:DUF5681 domain-containing protein [Sphingobium phenoxybenzoativorans]|uniref:DUF5681 domain-containing protein n=1 Tax=Sphingobium phenoxybenzoativorans TaxID=1592790 RepID=UPI000873320E|nr:DUF5681 domain-containing protein [Sphingobium phenoxybenzoativorans]
MTKRPENSGGNQGRFTPGQSGNPAGKPKGARHKVTLAIEELMEGEAEVLTRKAIELAKGGDIVALRLCLDRIAPARKDSPIAFDLPAIASAQDALGASAALLAAVAAGEVTPIEAGAVMGLLESHRRLVETGDHEARLTALEERSGK